MLDNQLIATISTQIEAAMAAAGWNYIVIQKDEPTQQGIPSAPAVFVQKIMDHEYGPQISSVLYQSIPDNFDATETQIVITTVQVSALVTQNPEDLSIPTASDVAHFTKMYLQHRNSIEILKTAGLNVIQVKEVRNPAFVDDKERYEYHPSFDIELQHERSITLTVHAVKSADGMIVSVPESEGERYP